MENVQTKLMFSLVLRNLYAYVCVQTCTYQNISESDKCNFLYATSINNGECGGLFYFSLYESMYIKLPEEYFGDYVWLVDKVILKT